MGRKPHIPTEQSRRLVRGLSGLGMPVKDIARLATMDDKTLYKYYEEEMEIGRAEANVRVSRSLFQAATRENNPNVIACMFWLKNRADWKDIGAPPGSNGGASSLRIEFVRAPVPAAEPKVIDAEPLHVVGNGEDKPANGEDRPTFEVPF